MSVPSPATCANTLALTALENIPALALKDMSSREQERVKVLGPCFCLGVKYDYLSTLHAHFRSESKLDMSALKEIYNRIWARYSQPDCHGKNAKARGVHKQGVSVSAPKREIYVCGVFFFSKSFKWETVLFFPLPWVRWIGWRVSKSLLRNLCCCVRNNSPWFRGYFDGAELFDVCECVHTWINSRLAWAIRLGIAHIFQYPTLL